MKKLLNSATRFLTVSLALVLALTVCIFSFLALFMSQKSAETINAVGTTYMTSMGEKVTQHFATTIELRLSQVESLVGSIPPESASSSYLREELSRNAKARDFAALAFYSSTGAFDMIYGEKPVLADPEPFLASMNSGDKKVKNTGSLAPQGMYASTAIVRFCADGAEYPRVVIIAAAVQPKPDTSEKAVLPERFTFSKSPSVAKANAEVTPLSSSNVRNKYSTAS